MDPMNQSAQISSSQGFADGQNSAAKESKLSDKRTVLSFNKPSEGVATSLRFPSQPSSFPPGKYDKEAGPPDVQPDSPIKTSPVSERIKALEALAAKKKEPDFRSDGGYSHFRDRHHEKSPTDNPKFPTETAKSPPETAKSPPETAKSPPETAKSPPETAKSPPETAKSPPETAKSPPETAKSPPETAKSPSQISKYLIEKNTPTTQKRGCSADPESPESPFEILGDLKQLNEFEETEDWMKAHLPPVPDFDSVGLNKSPDNVQSKEKETDMALPDTSAAFAGVPDAFMDSPIEGPDVKDELGDGQKQSSLEEEFDLRFLPTAYMCDQQEKSAFQAPSNPDPSISSSPAPLVGFESPSPLNVSPADTDVKQNVSEENTSWTTDTELPEASEADSSGESDDTVIEDGVGTPASAPALSSDSPVSNDPTVEKETPPVKSERKLMQVPTINVIETDEPNLSDEEMEIELEAEEDDEYEVVKDPYGEAPKSLETENDNTEPLKTRPLQTEFMEGYSPPSSPVDSDHEYSPKHNILKSNPIPPESQPKPEAQANSSISKDFDSDNPQAAESHTLSKKTIKEPSTFTITNEDEDLPDNDEWSDEARNILVKPYQTEHVSEEPVSIAQSTVYEKSNTEVRLSETNFMQDDMYDRQSFDYDYDASSPFEDIDNNGLPNAKERFLTDHASLEQKDVAEESHSLDKATSLNDDEDFSAQPCQTKYSQDSNSCFQSKTPSSVNEQEYNMKGTVDSNSDKVKDDTTGSKVQQDAKTAHHAPDKTGKPEGNADSEPETDSFVDFMRECLKSRHDEGPGCLQQGGPSKNEDTGPSLTHSQSPPSMVMNLEQEQLTIAALKQLGSSQEEEEEDEAAAIVNLQSSKDLDRDRANPGTTTHQSSIASITISPCAQSNRVLDNTYSKEVEAIDEWVAEAYHLAEHVLTAVLTHLSVKDLIHWRDPKKSGVVFGLSLLLLLSLAAFSVISVASYLLLALLCVTITFRIYKSVVQAVQKSNDGHPFKSLIDKDVSIPPETFRKNVDASLTYINRGLKQMSRLFLVEDLVDSLKLAVVMWLLTYVGAVFNGITILILADILLFAVPPVYEKNKTQIDQYIDLARTQINSTMAKLQDKLPGAVKRNKTE